jgi:Integrase core domain
VTAHPTADWTAQQILEAFPFDTAPKYLLRDRDRIYGQEFRKEVEVMNIKEILSAPRSPWQRAYVERVIGSIRRECLDHVIVFNEESLRRTLRSYFSYYHRSRLHLSLDKDSRAPCNRLAESSRFLKSVGCTIATSASPNKTVDSSMGRIVSKPIDGRYRSEHVENFKPSRLVERAALANVLHSSMPKQPLTRFSVSTNASPQSNDLAYHCGWLRTLE